MSQQSLPEGTVTILFTDVVGSTDLTTRRGDEAAREIFRAHFELVRQQVEQHSGQEVKTIGDGFMVAFASARRAVACAVGIQRALQQHNQMQAPDDQVRIRIGLNTGEVIQEEADLFGEAVNAAARIAAKAKGEQILISEAVKAIRGRARDFEVVDRGRFRLKGFPERWRLFEVVWQEEMPVTAPAITERTPFVGREVERAELRRLLDRAARGQGALVMIGGEPGVGKTRLAEELMAEARERGMTALLGRCYEMEGAPPYIPFVEMLEAAARTFSPEALRDALGESAPEVAKLMPELRRLFPDIPEPPELPPEQERRYLFNGMREFIARSGRAQPLLMVPDDLHWADDSTLLLLQHIAQHLHEMPVLILGTYRDVELDVARPLARALDELVRQRLAHDMSIKRLPEDGVAAMLRSLSGQEPPAPLVQAIYGETEGNAFFVEEVFKYLAEEGRLFDAEGRFRSDFRIGELEVPRGVRLVIGRRLERVSRECRRALTTAAVIGRGFSFELLEALTDVSADALLDAVDEAERAQLIAATSEGAAQTDARMGEARFTFAHELIRQTLLSGISAPRRSRLHLRVAQAMERVYARALEEHTADLAHHFYQAGSAADPEKTVHYLTLAGNQALAAAAYEEAARLYQMVLQALDLQEKPDERVRVDVLLALGLALGRGGADRPRVRAVFQRAAELSRRAGDSERCARAALGFATLWPTPGVVDADVVRLLEEALQMLGPAESALGARVLARLGQELYFSEKRDRGKLLVADGLQMARRIDDPGTLAYVLRYVALQEVDAARLLSLTREQIEAASRSGDTSAVHGAHGDLVRSMLALGDRAGLDLAVEEEERLQRQLRIGGGWTGLHRALQARMDGRFDAAERLAGQGFAEMQHNHAVAAQSFGAFLMGLRGHQGRLLELEPAVKANAQQYPAMPVYRAALAWVYSSDVRRRDDARVVFDELAEHGFGRLPSDTNLPATLSVLADVCWTLGDAGRAPELYEMLSPREGECVVVAWAVDTTGAASRSLALLAATMRRWEDAERHFEDALRTNALLGDKPWLAHTRAQYARMLIARDGPGDRDKAFRLLTEAIAMYREIGMPKHVEMAEALLREV